MPRTISGAVADDHGRPLAGATVIYDRIGERAIPGVFSAVTGPDGRFTIAGLPAHTRWPLAFTANHVEFAPALVKANPFSNEVKITLSAGCALVGLVVDDVTRRPASGAAITAQHMDEAKKFRAVTDAAGRYRLVLPEGNYNVLAEAPNRVCIALADLECPKDQQIELPLLELIEGGIISGRVLDPSTGQPVSHNERNWRITLGLFGPARPRGKLLSSTVLAEVSDDGRFVMRAAPGENFPYLINTRGTRTIFDTHRQAPVVVEAGKTVQVDVELDRPVPREEKMAHARKVVMSLPQDPRERVARIIAEFRKLNHTVDETELWCSLMRELVAVGAPAVPQLCAELDHTSEQFMLRRLGFALRAIGDPRAVPALIRSIPKTLHAPLSDYGLLVEDKELTTFMQLHDLGNEREEYFDLGRPAREIFGALHKLARKNLDDFALQQLTLVEDRHGQALQRRMIQQHARRWQAWWEEHYREFVDDEAYARVGLAIEEAITPPKRAESPRKLRSVGRSEGMMLSPPSEENPFATFFLDLDTDLELKWPKHIARGNSTEQLTELSAWAAETGVDLMCVDYQPDVGKATYALRGFNLRLREVSLHDARNIERRVASGKLSEGEPVGELLLHYDRESRRFLPEANAAFIYITREGGMGMIEVTDRITRVVDRTGQIAFSPSPRGEGYFRGVQFDWTEIVADE